MKLGLQEDGGMRIGDTEREKEEMEKLISCVITKYAVM